VRIHSGCFLELVTIEDDVFVGPHVVFTDDPHPMNCPRYAECKGGAVVRRLARIGAVVAGNPARVIKQVSELTCPPGWFERPLHLAALRRAPAVRPRRRLRRRAAALRASGEWR